MFELASILGDSIESLLNHLTTQNGTYLSQYSAGQPAFGRFLPVAAGVLVASYVAIAHAAR